MLIYNYKKEFLGIDEDDLKALGLKNLADLRAESEDFADLFVKTPGCIHNFKHVHWIDYVLDDSGTESKAVIHVKDKNYSTNITIKTIYLVDNPSTKAYLVELTNLRTLSGSQIDKLSADISKKQAPKTATGSTELFTTPGSIVHNEYSRAEEEVEEIAYDPYESDESTASTVKDIYESQSPLVEDFAVDETPLKIDVQETFTDEPEEDSYIAPEAPSVTGDAEFSDYRYDPQVASDELGLPVDLIQEFIQDFIAQAESFKTELYESAKSSDFDHLKIQSHKLKGVAANLRIQDALNALTIINSSEDYDEIKTNLDSLYIMISKLSDKHSPIEKAEIAEVKEDEEEEFVLSIKGDKPSPVTQEEVVEEVNFANDVVLDSDVPNNISIPELADDDFLEKEVNLDTLSEIQTDSEVDDFSIDDLEETPLESDSDDKPETYDKKLIADDFGLDIESFNELFDDFIAESTELSDTIVQSANENNLVSCKSMATKMKGMSDNMRIHRFDTELEDIINATSTQSVKESIELVKSKINKISNSEDK